MGHRDGLPEDPLGELAWMKQVLDVAEKYGPLPGFNQEWLDRFRMNYETLALLTEADPEPEPDPLEGWTIYWDRLLWLCLLFNRYCESVGSQWRIHDVLDEMQPSSILDELYPGWLDFLNSRIDYHVEHSGLSPERAAEIHRRIDDVRDGGLYDEVPKIQRIVLACFLKDY